MADLDLNALEAVAKAATPGPWFENHGWLGGQYVYVATGTHPRDEGYRDVATVGATHEADATYIATFGPPTVLALIERLRRAEGECCLHSALCAKGREVDAAVEAREGPMTFDREAARVLVESSRPGTPGPWWIPSRYDDNVVLGADGALCIVVDGPQDWLPDARAIAALPELHDALAGALGRMDEMEGALREADKALRANVTTWITLEPKLTDPFPDDPRWSPWTRFGKRAAMKAQAARDAIRAALASDGLASLGAEDIEFDVVDE